MNESQKQYAKWKKKGKTNLRSTTLRILVASEAAVTKTNQLQKQDNFLEWR